MHAKGEDWRSSGSPSHWLGGTLIEILFSDTKAAKGPYRKKGVVGGCLKKVWEELLMVFVSRKGRSPYIAQVKMREEQICPIARARNV